MQSKKSILILIIVVVLFVAGIFAYKAIMGPSNSTTTTTGSTPTVSGAILPHGRTLNFDVVKKFNKTDKLFPYPSVAPTDIGQPSIEVVSPK